VDGTEYGSGLIPSRGLPIGPASFSTDPGSPRIPSASVARVEASTGGIGPGKNARDLPPLRTDYPAISRWTILEIAEALGLNPNLVETIHITADKVTATGQPGQAPLELRVVDG
jgi:hypothetical protein